MVTGTELPLCVPFTITQNCSVPLPAASVSDEAHDSCTESFAAHVPLRSHVVPQVPPVHEAAPASEAQTCPHVPQLLVVVVDVSQPLDGSPSQSAKPAAHTGAHVELTQLVVPCGLLQTGEQVEASPCGPSPPCGPSSPCGPSCAPSSDGSASETSFPSPDPSGPPESGPAAESREAVESGFVEASGCSFTRSASGSKSWSRPRRPHDTTLTAMTASDVDLALLAALRARFPIMHSFTTRTPLAASRHLRRSLRWRNRAIARAARATFDNGSATP